MAEEESAHTGGGGFIGKLKDGGKNKTVVLIAMVVVGGIALMALHKKMAGGASTTPMVQGPPIGASQPANNLPAPIDLGQFQNIIGTMSSQYQDFLNQQSTAQAANKTFQDALYTKLDQNTQAVPSSGTVTTYLGGEHHTFVDSSGNLIHQFFDANVGHWISENHGGGYAPGSTPQVNVYGNQFQIMAPKSDGTFGHLWYTPGTGWGTDKMSGDRYKPMPVVTPPGTAPPATHPPAAVGGGGPGWAGPPPQSMMTSTPGGPPVTPQTTSGVAPFGTMMPYFWPLTSDGQMRN